VTFFDELKRRNVLRVAAAYIVTAWLIIQVAETILPYYDLERYVRTVITVLAIGFVPAMILAWALEWTPEGIKLDAGADAETASAATIRVANVEETAISYMAGNTTRLRVKVVGEIAGLSRADTGRRTA
jgi:hypothetical protein